MLSKQSLWFIGLLIAGGGQAHAVDDAREIVESNIARWNEALATREVDDIVSLYTDNAMLVQPNGAVSKSQSEIHAFWQTLIEKMGGVVTLSIVDAKVEQEGLIVTKTTLSDVKTLRNTQQTMRYHYDGVLYSVLKRQSDGSWKAAVQKWSDKSKT